jgi:hypothetical protein
LVITTVVLTQHWQRQCGGQGIDHGATLRTPLDGDPHETKGAVDAASLGDHVAVRDYLRECDRAAQLTGDRNDFWLAPRRSRLSS